jgi:Ti-type conjugative transfer relaxase TraA
MAIFHVRMQVIGRSTGRSAVAAAAYRAAELLHDERQGRAHDFTAKEGVVHSEIMLPEGAPERWRDRATLWNEVEATERRRDAQLARELEFSIPRELSQAEAVQLAHDFVSEQFVSRGMVADVNVHWATAKDGEAQPHAHVMLTMRSVEGDGFGPKAREWNSRELYEGVRERWAALANERLAEHGHDARIDHRSYAEQGIPLEPQHKIGPAGARRAERGEDAERAAEHDGIARRNGEQIAADPAVALDALTRQHSTFTKQDLARFVNRHTADSEQFAAVMAKVEASAELVRLGVDGRGRERFSTREMVAAEQRMEAVALGLGGSWSHRVGVVEVERAVRRAEAGGLQLGAEQQHAVHRVTAGRDLALVVGYAGTGKSAMLRVARQAWEAAGYRVRGAALSGIAAEGLEGGSGIESRTLASLEWGWKEGRDQLTARDVLVVDEAGMVGSRQMERVLSHAREAGAKVVLVGDPEQLQAIEAGAAFRVLAERHGAAEIGAVRRQREGWQREATRELATGRTGVALGRYEAAGMVQGHATQDEARAALVAGWAAERHQSPRQSQVILAYTRVDVAELNVLARERLRQVGELGADQVVQTERGERAMAAGDRLMFLRNERGLGAGPAGRGGVVVKNGTLGTVLAVEAGGERLTVRLDGPEGKDAPVVTFYVRDYGHLDHGYAATIHKAQGVTVDRAHVLASAHMDRHAAYVALTRHRDGVALHYDRSEFADGRQLARTLGRERAKDVTLDYGGPGGGPARDRDQVAAYAEQRGLDPLRPESELVVPRPMPEQSAPEPAVSKRERLKQRVRAAAQRQGRPAPGQVAAEVVPAPLLPAHWDAWGRDSQGRGTTPAEVAAATERSEGVRKALGDLGLWVRQAYRDPDAAVQRLEALEAAEGGPKGAERALHRHDGGPELLGELRGKVGWFVSAASKAEREVAVRCAGSVGGGLVRLREAEERAGQGYVRDVDAQRARDAVEVPGLSPAAWAAMRVVEQAGDVAEREAKAKPGYSPVWGSLTARQGVGVAEAWAREVEGRPAVAAELRTVAEAAGRCLGEDGVRELVRGVRGVQDGPGQREGLAGIGRVLAASGEGQRAFAAQQDRAREAERERLGLRQGRGPRMGM